MTAKKIVSTKKQKPKVIKTAEANKETLRQLDVVLGQIVEKHQEMAVRKEMIMSTILIEAGIKPDDGKFNLNADYDLVQQLPDDNK